MASLGQIILCSMITLIILLSAIIILILALAFTVPKVKSQNTRATADLGKDVLLSCYLNQKSDQVRIKSATWEKLGTGLVYQYKDGAPALGDQSSEFKGRTQLSADGLVTGNASLLLNHVKKSDEGVYTCSIDTSDGGGKVNINLTTVGIRLVFPAWMCKFSCYLLSNESDSWDKGREDCRSRGADLVIIDGDEEEEFLTKLVNKNTWIGLTDRNTENTWTWIDGTPLTLRYWARGQPDNGGGRSQLGEEDCVHIIDRVKSKHNWNDRPCDHSMRWICEKKV